MAKKSKAERNAIRKQGWKEAGAGLKQMYIDSSANALAEIGKGYTQGVASGRNSKNENPKTNAIGKGIAGLGGAFVGAIKSIPKSFKSMAQGNWQFLKGVWKGIFNHPSWYAYRNVLSIPAYNANRPFDTVALKNVLGSAYAVPTIGVTHIVKQNVVYHDMINDPSFRLATIEAFKQIRLELRSNLPYTQEQYDSYVAMAVSILVKAKAIERALGWYNVTRADIPELQEAMHSVPINMTEIGKVTSQGIALLDNANYATTLNTYKKLQAIISNICIPHKLAEFISWWVGAVFIDQAAPNAQLYVNEIRSCPVYSIDSNNELQISGTWDIMNGDIDTVINEAMSLLNNYGIMNADIDKTGRYGKLSICDVDDGKYSPITLSDPEFFTILINSYGIERTDPYYQATVNSEYVRIDCLDPLGPPNLVGVTNALAKWATKTVPFTIESQCAYFVSDNTLYSTRNVNGSGDLSSNVSVHGYDTEKSFWYQTTGKVFVENKYSVVDSSTQIQYNYSESSRISGSMVGSVNAMGWNLSRRTIEFNCADGTPYTLIPLIKSGSTNNWFHLRIQMSGTTVANVDIFEANAKYEGSYVTSPTGTSFLLLSNATDYTGTGSTVLPGITHVKIVFKGSNKTLLTTDYVKLAGYYSDAAEFTSYAAQVLVTFYVSYTTSATKTGGVIKFASDMLSMFMQAVDYHIPVWYFQGDKVTDGVKTLTVDSVPFIYKQTYIPLLFNASDIEAVLYWMYLGLFSME